MRKNQIPAYRLPLTWFRTALGCTHPRERGETRPKKGNSYIVNKELQNCTNAKVAQCIMHLQKYTNAKFSLNGQLDNQPCKRQSAGSNYRYIY